MFLPRAVGGQVRAGGPVRATDDFVDSLNLSGSGCKHCLIVSTSARPTGSRDRLPPKYHHPPSQCRCEVFVRSDRSGPEPGLC